MVLAVLVLPRYKRGMKIVLSWLQDYLTFHQPVDVPALCALLVRLGHEVDGVQEATPRPDAKVLIGKIISREPHPDAARLGVCQVDVGEGFLRQIVCGAPNARAGITVPVAMPGAKLPQGVEISETILRGVASRGMICSARELGLGDEHSGIMELDAGLVVGTQLAETMGKSEIILDVALTPNRGDCFSHLGIARELAAAQMGILRGIAGHLGAAVHQSTPFEALKNASGGANGCIDGEAGGRAEVRGGVSGGLKADTRTAGCLQLNVVKMVGLRAGAVSPPDVQARLLAAGLRPKNALVDATNYTMLALGQPLHAYDARKLGDDSLMADVAKGGEVFAGLGDVTLTLQAEDLVIVGADGAVVGLAGILGGSATAVDDMTTEVLLEAGVFDPVAVALTGQRHHLHTDARQRFERGVDPALAPVALQFCADMLTAWAEGTVVAQVTAGTPVAAPAPIAYDPAFYARLIGQVVTPERQAAHLRALGFGVEDSGLPWQVVPPSWRTFMATPEDVTEEILRLEGFETVQPSLPPVMPPQLQVDGARVRLDRVARKALAAAGFVEVMTYSFIGRAAAARAVADAGTLLELSNPLAQTEMTTMRPSLLPGLLQALAKNLAASDLTPRLAEVGQVYFPAGEQLMAAGVLCATGQRHWRTPEVAPDAFAAKAAALQVLELLGAPVASLQVDSLTDAPMYHPGQSGVLRVGPMVLATFGVLHPSVQTASGLPTHLPPVAVFEVHLHTLLKLTSKVRPWQAWAYPPVHRDVALLVPKATTAQALVHTLRASVPSAQQAWLRTLEVFDVYDGVGVPDGQKSIGIAVTLQNPAGTLSEAEVAPLVGGMVAAATAKLGAVLRG